jgi:hypothetical protein
MANVQDTLTVLSPDRLRRSVSVVVDPRDIVSGRRVTGPLNVRLRGVAAEPVAALSGAYCFVDLRLPAGTYVAVVEAQASNRTRYFDAEIAFGLVVVPAPGQPLVRNPVDIALLPRPGYPFDGQSTLARGRLLGASSGSAVANARVALVLEGADKGIRSRTDDRGEFAMSFPPTGPEDAASAGLKKLKFRLRFEVEGRPPLVTGEAQVEEGSTKSLGEIKFTGL